MLKTDHCITLLQSQRFLFLKASAVKVDKLSLNVETPENALFLQKEKVKTQQNYCTELQKLEEQKPAQT